MQKQRNWMKIIGAVLLCAMLTGGVILGVRVAKLVDMTLIEARTTPTPVPEAGNVMQVTPDPNAPTPEPMLRTGSQGEDVKKLQSRLQTLGYYDGAIDGQFGGGTKKAVILFQQQNGLGADGIVGAETRAVLYSARAKAAVFTPTPAPTATPVPTPEGIPGYTEDGLPMLVNRQNLLPDDYEPVHLVNMMDYCDSSIVKIKGSGIEGEKVAVDALMDMLRAAHAEGITVWQVSAGWRSVNYQRQLFNDKVAEYRAEGFSQKNAESAASKTVADPGASEHHTGLAFDITVPGTTFAGTKQAKWLAENCWDYGFILRYTADKEHITGFVAEAWHFRYVGVDHAIRMRDQQLCLEEYIEFYGNQ